MYMYEVDMSGKIEETNKPTALALAGRVNFTLYISATEKQKLLKALRAAQPKWSRAKISTFIFATLLYFLLRDHIQKASFVTIDLEYTGHDGVIKNRLIYHCHQAGIPVYKEQITFASVTKKSPSHKLAWRVFKGIDSPNLVISAHDVLDLFGR